jgi:hypothetical protein
MDHACTCTKQTGADNFTREQWQLIDGVIEKFRDRPGALVSTTSASSIST